MDLSSGAVWSALGAIIVANVLLSGDNAVVIALAARSLPARRRRQAIVWGSAAAIALRVVLTLAALQVLQLPYLKLAGASALLWIGVRLIVDPEKADGAKVEITLLAAIRTILVADLVMSLDNVIAVAAAADSGPPEDRVPLLVVGLATSIPLLVAGSALLMKVMDRYPVIIIGGAAVLGALAGRMIVTDPAVAGWFESRIPQAGLVFGVVGALFVAAVGRGLHLRSKRRETA